jgi:hypothetical protein
VKGRIYLGATIRGIPALSVSLVCNSILAGLHALVARSVRFSEVRWLGTASGGDGKGLRMPNGHNAVRVALPLDFDS